LTRSCGLPINFLLLQPWCCPPARCAGPHIVNGCLMLYYLVLWVASKVVVNVVFRISGLVKQSACWEENQTLKIWMVSAMLSCWTVTDSPILCTGTEACGWAQVAGLYSRGVFSVNHWRILCRLQVGYFYTCMVCYFV
jgi:hypothetical protein